MIHKRPAAQEDKVIVTFEIPASVWAESISLSGDFKQWDPIGLALHPNRKGNWRVELELERGQAYRFCYLIDGNRWTTDRHADGHAFSPDGGVASIVIADC